MNSPALGKNLATIRNYVYRDQAQKGWPWRMTQDVDNKKLIASVVLLERFVRDIYPTKHSSAIQPLQWSILRYLERMPVERCEPRWIAKFLGLTRAPVTRAIATLERHDYVHQITNGDDARTKTIALTPLGSSTLASDPILDAVKQIRALPEIEQTHFINAIRSIALNSVGSNDEQT